MVNNSKVPPSSNKQNRREKDAVYQAIRNINSAKPDSRSPLKKSISLTKRAPPHLSGQMQVISKVSKGELPAVAQKKAKSKTSKTYDPNGVAEGAKFAPQQAKFKQI